MPNRLEVGAYDGKGYVRLTAALDANGLGFAVAGVPVIVGAGNVLDGAAIECTAMRRYRLKWTQLTGTGPSTARAFDLPFAPDPLQVWEQAVLSAAVFPARYAVNFGEGTAIMTCFMGPYLEIQLQNNGPDAATYDAELWMQS